MSLGGDKLISAPIVLRYRIASDYDDLTLTLISHAFQYLLTTGVTPMKYALAVLLTLLLSSCGSKLDATYSNNMTGVGEQKLSFTFKPDGTSRMAIGSTQIPLEMPYEVSGNKIKVTGQKGDIIFTILDNGDLLSEGMRLTKEIASLAAQISSVAKPTEQPALVTALNPAATQALAVKIQPSPQASPSPEKSGTNIGGGTECFSELAINKSIEKLGDSYADVQPSINCEKKVYGVGKLICSSNTLKLMDMLDTKAYVYALENATKNEIDHKNPTMDTTWISKVRNECTDNACLCKVFKVHTESPRVSWRPVGLSQIVVAT